MKNLWQSHQEAVRKTVKKVAGGQGYKLQYEQKKTGASKKEIKKAITSEGNSRKKVEQKLDKND